jgi:hypothetical protein
MADRATYRLFVGEGQSMTITSEGIHYVEPAEPAEPEAQHTEIVQPQADLPPEIVKQPGAIDLYRLALYGLVGIAAVGIVGMIVVPAIGRTVSDGVQVITSVAVGALAGMVSGRMSNA